MHTGINEYFESMHTIFFVYNVFGRARAKNDIDIGVRELLDLLSLFFSERRVLVSDSFADFESL